MFEYRRVVVCFSWCSLLSCPKLQLRCVRVGRGPPCIFIFFMGVFPSWFFLAIGSMYAIYIYIYIYIYISMVTWIPSIYPLDLSIFLPAPWIRHGNGTHWAGPGGRSGTHGAHGTRLRLQVCNAAKSKLGKVVGDTRGCHRDATNSGFSPELARNDVQKRTAILKCHLNAEKYDIISLW